MRSKLRLPRRFPPTREGWWFLLATLLVGAAAVNGGINLLFLVFGMMIFLILASGILSELCLRKLQVSRRPPAAIHAGTPYLMGIAVRNDKRRMPTFSLEVEDVIEGRPVDRRCYYLKLPPGRTQETAYRNVLVRRGYHKLTGYRIATRFPFGLIRKSRDVEAPAQLLVLPALVPVPESLLPAGRADAGRRHGVRPNPRGDFAGLREYRAGDDPRDIHWRTSARRGRPFIRESEDESGRTVIVTLAGGPEAMPGEPFEAAVSMTASIAVALLRRGYEVGLDTDEGFHAPGSGPLQAGTLLRALALVQPVGEVDARRQEERAATARRFAGAARLTVSPGAGAPRVLQGSGPEERRSA
jgi:uncharacterized protein (DUF58 family)